MTIGDLRVILIKYINVGTNDKGSQYLTSRSDVKISFFCTYEDVQVLIVRFDAYIVGIL
jgi:hypothetical protein